jgi:SAM-dependent methyltransferase
MSLESSHPTFRDPAGSLSFEQDHAIRRIGADFRAPVLTFLDSAFCRAAQARGDLIAAAIDDSPAGLILRHPRIPFPTYPWEWTPRQWQAAGDLTLRLGQEALAEGWILKDATPLNILFDGSRPVFVDILSFDPRAPESPVWLAYGQYVRTFLLPLLAHRMLHWPLAMTLFHRDGYEPSELYAALGWGQRLSPSALWTVTLPALLERRKKPEEQIAAARARTLPPDVATAVLTRTMEGLRKRTRSVAKQAGPSEWSEYTGSLTHYTAEQSAAKAAWVKAVLEQTAPATVLDIGANTGEFSAMAAQLGAQVVALERDEPAADRIVQMATQKNLPILAVHADLSRPAPAAGWENRESAALLPRLEGRFDLVFMLAVIHHLILMEQIPIPAILKLVRRLTRHRVVIEWVPVNDPMYQSLMRGREGLYGALTEADLLSACEHLFRVIDRHVLGNGRVLFLFETIPE